MTYFFGSNFNDCEISRAITFNLINSKTAEQIDVSVTLCLLFWCSSQIFFLIELCNLLQDEHLHYNTYNNNITLTFALTMYMFLALRILTLLIPALVPIHIILLQYKKAS